MCGSQSTTHHRQRIRRHQRHGQTQTTPHAVGPVLALRSAAIGLKTESVFRWSNGRGIVRRFGLPSLRQANWLARQWCGRRHAFFCNSRNSIRRSTRIFTTFRAADLNTLFIDHTGIGLTTLLQFADRRARQARRCWRTMVKAFLSLDTKHKAGRAKIAIRNDQIVGLQTRQNLSQQGPLLSVGIFLQHQVSNQTQSRLIDHQGLTRQAGVEPAS